MCWSATADLVAGTAISAAGIAAVAGTLRHGRVRELPLAALPLLLGAHQLVEAAVWQAGGGTGPATTAWAVIALPVLAAWVPLGVLLATPPAGRARLYAPAALGALTAAVLSWVLATRTVGAEVRERTVGYAIGLPHAAWLLAGYLLATVGSLLLARDRVLRLLGVLTGVSAAACAVLWRTAFVSTWCAAAALASLVLVAWALRRAPSGSRPAPRHPAGPAAPAR